MQSPMHQHLPLTPRWQSPEQVQAPAIVMDWLLDTGSLTQRLKRHGSFHVEPQEEWRGMAPLSDYGLLELPPEEALVRDVILALDDEPVVLARSVIPQSALMGENAMLSQMANRSLGLELFQTPKAIREQLWLTQLPSANPLGALWGRQSRFNKRGGRLLVAEYFLPALWRRLEIG